MTVTDVHAERASRGTLAPKRTRHRACDCHILLPEQVVTVRAATTSIDDLNLVDYAADAARELLRRHPEVVFTSGRRDAQQQASAMAGNVVRKQKWIALTYASTPERDALQGWVDTHPGATTRGQIAAGLFEIMDQWSDAQKRKLSRHFSGQAFDVKPVPNGSAIKATIKSLPNLRKFLQTEGGLTIWHADFEM